MPALDPLQATDIPPSTLSLDLAYTDNSRHYELNAVDMGPGSRVGSLFRTQQSALHFSGPPIYINRSQIFLGSITSSEGNTASDVICKLIEGNVSRLRTEAEHYAVTLKKVQGLHVPAFYGYFVGTSSYNDQEIACILLENGGACLSRGEWLIIPIEIRVNVLDKLMLLHSLGIYHNDFGPWSVVINSSGQLRIIDFDRAEIHKCRVKKRLYKMYELEPSPTQLACIEVRSISKALDIWTPRDVCFQGISVDMCKIKGPEDIVEAVHRYTSISSMSPEEMLYEANELIKAYDERYLKRIRLARESAKKAAVDPKGVADVTPDDKKSSVVKELGQLSIHTPSARSSHVEV